MTDHDKTCPIRGDLAMVEAHLGASLAVAARELSRYGRRRPRAAETLRWMLQAAPAERRQLLVDRLLDAARDYLRAEYDPGMSDHHREALHTRLLEMGAEAAHEHVTGIRQKRVAADGAR